MPSALGTNCSSLLGGEAVVVSQRKKEKFQSPRAGIEPKPKLARVIRGRNWFISVKTSWLELLFLVKLVHLRRLSFIMTQKFLLFLSIFIRAIPDKTKWPFKGAWNDFSEFLNPFGCCNDVQLVLLVFKTLSPRTCFWRGYHELTNNFMILFFSYFSVCIQLYTRNSQVCSRSLSKICKFTIKVSKTFWLKVKKSAAN